MVPHSHFYSNHFPAFLCSFIHACAAAKSLQSCLTLCDPIDSTPPVSSVPRILQARTLELVAISFSNAWKWKVKVKSLSRVWLFETPWTVAYQAPLSMGFSRQEYWSGLPFPSPYTCICKSKQLNPSNFSFHKFEILIFILEFTTFQNLSLFKHLPFSKKRQECWTH